MGPRSAAPSSRPRHPRRNRKHPRQRYRRPCRRRRPPPRNTRHAPTCHTSGNRGAAAAARARHYAGIGHEAR
eukprot:6740979-Alexandrium_andersonii.AAC.1